MISLSAPTLRRTGALILAALLLGLALLLARPWVAPGQVKAAGPIEVRCVGFENSDNRKATVHVHNAGTAEAPFDLTWLDGDGNTVEMFSLVVAAGATSDQSRTAKGIGAVAKIASPSDGLVIDAEMIYDDRADEQHRRTVTC